MNEENVKLDYADVDQAEEQERYFSEKVLIYYKFRFTFSDQDKEHNYDEKYIKKCKSITKGTVEKLLSLYNIRHLTAGLEQTNKSGDKTLIKSNFQLSSLSILIQPKLNYRTLEQRPSYT